MYTRIYIRIEADNLSLSTFYVYVCNMYIFIYSNITYAYVWVDTIVPTDDQLLLNEAADVSFYTSYVYVYV